VSEPVAFRSALKNPWWIPPFLGGVPDVDPALIRLLGLVSLAVFFEQYDNSMLTSALKFIAEDLGMAENQLGGFLAAIKIGALPAFFVVPFADRIGRRRVFLVSVFLFSLCTCLTGLAQSATQFVLLQSVTRTFMTAATAVALVIITEEYPAAYRGWAIGMFGALSSCGHGLGAGLFAAIESMPFGWRGLYFIGLVPLLLMPLLRRGVSETARFRRHHAAQGQTSDSMLAAWAKPLLSLARTHPARAAGLGIVAGLFAIGESSVFQFTGYFTLTVHGWTPGQFSLMFILGGAVGIIGNVVAGRLGDRIGRRIVGLVFFTLFPLFSWIFYHGPSWSLPLAWTGFVFCNTAGGVIVRALATELFPTSHRGTASAWVALVQTVGWAGGLAIVGMGTQAPGDIAAMTSLTSLVVLVAGVALLFLPETTRRELETISHDVEPEEAALASLAAAERAIDGR
jgi:MFS family permease